MRREGFISELVNSVHPKDGHDKAFAMLQAYLDESGIHGDAHACVVAGYTGSVAAWKKFERPWCRLLKKYALSEFHAQRFWGFQEGGKRASPFYSWTDERADEFLEEVFRIIEDSRIAPVGAAVPAGDWTVVPKELRHFLTGGDYDPNRKTPVTPGAPNKSYHLALGSCLVNAARHAPAGSRVHFVLDLNNQLAPYATKLFQKYREKGSIRVRKRLGSISFETSDVALPLQAADLLAFQLYKQVGFKLVGQEQPRNPILERALCNLKSQQDIPLYDARGLDLVLQPFR